MKITDLMNELQLASKKEASKTDCFGFGCAEFRGHQISARTLIVNTNSKDGVSQTIWWVDGKKISRNKLESMFA